MRIMHIALGGCLVAQQVRYGVTEDTGGHIAYVLGAARGQAATAGVEDVEIVTRRFEDPGLGAIHACDAEIAGPRLRISRLSSRSAGYLSKEALVAELPDLTRAFIDHLRHMTLKPDVIHAHFADAAVLARAARRIFGIPMVYTPHSLAIDKIRSLTQTRVPALDRRIKRESAALVGADAVVVSSRDEAERQIAGYGLDVCGQVHRITPGVDLPEPGDMRTGTAKALIAPFLTDPERPMILAIARPVERKNLLTLARLYRSSKTLQDAANLVILAGQHPDHMDTDCETGRVLTSLKDVLGDTSLRGRVALPAHHDPATVAELYRLAARQRGVFVNVALHEPFGLTILEAASHGLPCVVTEEGGPPDILSHLRCGIVVPPTDDRRIETAIASLLTDQTRWTTASRNALGEIPAFSWSGWAKHSVGVYASLRMRSPRFTDPQKLLACDMDNTLTGCADGVAAFRDWHSTRDIPFVLATGRSLSEARAILAHWTLPEPDAFITAVGTEVHLRSACGRLEFSQGYADQLDRDWDRETVLSAIRKTGVPLQPGIEQRRWKLCCFGTARDAARIKDALAQEGLTARVVHSHDRLIDILPRAGGKAAGVAFVARHFGLTPRDCIAAGDSGNDIDMLRAVGHPILVGNALAELRSRVPSKSAYGSARPYAHGVLDGLAFHTRTDAARRTERVL